MVIIKLQPLREFLEAYPDVPLARVCDALPAESEPVARGMRQ